MAGAGRVPDPTGQEGDVRDEKRRGNWNMQHDPANAAKTPTTQVYDDGHVEVLK